MEFKAGVGFSEQRNPQMAGREAVERAMEAADCDAPHLVMVFATANYAQDTLVRAAYETGQGALLVGGSMEGIITPDHVYESNFGVGAAVFACDAMRFHLASSEGMSHDSESVGRVIGRELGGAAREEGSMGLFTFADGLTTNFNAFFRGLHDDGGLPEYTPVLGGAAGDSWKFAKTYQYVNDRALTDSTAALLMSGEGLSLSAGSTHGCTPVGAQRTVTKSVNNVIHEIDGEPALDVLYEYIDGDSDPENWQSTLIQLAIGLPSPDYMAGRYDELIVRFFPGKDDEARTLTIPTEIAEGTQFWMVRRDPDKIARANEAMGTELRERVGDDEIKMVFHFDCAGRGKVMFDEHHKRSLLTDLRHTLAPQAPWFGSYCYGELAPIAGCTTFHSYTATLAAIHG